MTARRPAATTRPPVRDRTQRLVAYEMWKLDRAPALPEVLEAELAAKRAELAERAS